MGCVSAGPGHAMTAHVKHRCQMFTIRKFTGWVITTLVLTIYSFCMTTARHAVKVLVDIQLACIYWPSAAEVMRVRLQCLQPMLRSADECRPQDGLVPPAMWHV